MCRSTPLSLALLLAACPGPAMQDAGTKFDAGVPDSGRMVNGPACGSSRDCKLAAYDGVCRAAFCTATALCVDDVECGLGENCVEGACRFTGCASNADCATGRCRTDVFTCAECGVSSDCPPSRPVCDPTNTCVQCSTDAQCQPPGPGHCDAPGGACVHCLEDKHCPNGLTCGAGHLCTGAKLNAPCPTGTACDTGLTCVGIGGVQTCLPSCRLTAPNCKPGDICYKLVDSMRGDLIFDQGGPLGVCYLPQQNLKGYRESCNRTLSTVSTSNCQPNLACVPESATLSLCRTYCDLNTSGACPGGEVCHPLIGDSSGRRYGLCYPDNGWGLQCSKDGTCKPNQACAPFEDPSVTDRLSPVCQYAVGALPALAPCQNLAQPDGGVVLADKTCQSGGCVADPLLSSAKFFCYAACKTNQDCTVGTRTGVCDGVFTFPIGAAPSATAKVAGCRPGCASTTGCGEYGAGIVCRSRYLPGYASSFATSCAAAAGSGLAGTPCTVNSQCRSGFCVTQDGRGVARAGYCLEACETAADCAGGGASTGPLACGQLVVNGFKGYDGVGGTSDDRLHPAKLCGGGACTADEDCGDDAGVRCVPDLAMDWFDGGNRTLVLRCRPSNASGMLLAGTSCVADSQCASGLCGVLQSPSMGSGKACFQACTTSTVCPGTSTCREGGMQVPAPSGGVNNLDSCAL